MTDANTESVSESKRDAPAPRWLIRLAIVLGAILVLAWLVVWLHHRLTHVSENDARIASHVITVSSRLPGRVSGFDLIQGDHLRENETIAQLYSEPDTLQRDKLKARVENIQTELALARQQIGGGVASAKARLAADQSARAAAKARMDKAHNNYVRAQNLYEAKGGTEKQRDIYRYDYESAQADYRRAQSQVKQDQVMIANAKTGLLAGGQVGNPDVLKSQLAIARAELAHQQNMIDDLTVASPIHGVVDQTFIEQAEYISAGQPIVMMHDPADVWVEANIKETAVGDLAVGQPVKITVDARPDTAYHGHIQVIGGAATNQFALLPDPNPSGNFTKITQRIPVRIAIDHGPKRQVSPGMMVEVDIDITGDGTTDANQQQAPIRTRADELGQRASAQTPSSPTDPASARSRRAATPANDAAPHRPELALAPAAALAREAARP
ncbi:HlyD family secretion protein [uncultured Salinisphaera sp.]|uniref:HlyD family secretion protein n=1 Tax=uncultured Salinisphaera sp. TaxID=359372 RepID=UPI0032B208C5